MKLIGRVLWRATVAPPTWWALLNMFYAAFTVGRIWYTGRERVTGVPVLGMVMLTISFLGMAYFWHNPVPMPPSLKDEAVRHSGC